MRKVPGNEPSQMFMRADLFADDLSVDCRSESESWKSLGSKTTEGSDSDPEFIQTPRSPEYESVRQMFASKMKEKISAVRTKRLTYNRSRVQSFRATTEVSQDWGRETKATTTSDRHPITTTRPSHKKSSRPNPGTMQPPVTPRQSFRVAQPPKAAAQAKVVPSASSPIRTAPTPRSPALMRLSMSRTTSTPSAPSTPSPSPRGAATRLPSSPDQKNLVSPRGVTRSFTSPISGSPPSTSNKISRTNSKPTSRHSLCQPSDLSGIPRPSVSNQTGSLGRTTSLSRSSTSSTGFVVTPRTSQRPKLNMTNFEPEAPKSHVSQRADSLVKSLRQMTNNCD